MGRLLVLLAILWLLWWGFRWFQRTPSRKIAGHLRTLALWGGLGILVLLVVTGRLSPLLAAIAAAIPTLSRLLNLIYALPVIREILGWFGFGKGRGSEGDGESAPPSLRTESLEVILDPAGHILEGWILDGPDRGQPLSALDQHRLLALLERYRGRDPQSAALLAAYLSHRGDEEPRSGRSGAMGSEEARAILGLDEGATEDAIHRAHRRLIQRLHPDRGGSDYLAAKINEAKRVLLNQSVRGSSRNAGGGCAGEARGDR